MTGATLPSASDVQSSFAMPHWIAPAIRITRGRDPIGMQTITTDRIMPILVPGILTLSRRARYFSYYAFLLDEYQAGRYEPSWQAMSNFIRRREFELAVASQFCSRGCGEGSAIVGQNSAGPAARRMGEALERNFSVQSGLGGFGLYYRSPMIDLGLVAPAGTPYGSERVPTPIDVLAGGRARELAGHYRNSIATTRYYQKYFRGTQTIPRDVLAELAEVGCLCRLNDFIEERTAIHDALLDYPIVEGDSEAAGELRRLHVDQRRRSLAILLWAIRQDQTVAVGPWHDGAFRNAIWQGFEQHQTKNDALAQTLAQWAALIAKDVLQEALSSIWGHFCWQGLSSVSHPEGLTPKDLKAFVREELPAATTLQFNGVGIPISPALPVSDLILALDSAAAGVTLEHLRWWTADQGTTLAGLTGMLMLHSRLPDPTECPPGWVEIGRQSSHRQAGLLATANQLDDYLDSETTIADLLEWIIEHRILWPHEVIAYEKLPEFTFRFRWELGRLRFFDNGAWRFGLNDIRRDAMSRITNDLGLWETVDGHASLTEFGQKYLIEVFG